MTDLNEMAKRKFYGDVEASLKKIVPDAVNEVKKLLFAVGGDKREAARILFTVAGRNLTPYDLHVMLIAALITMAGKDG